MRPSLMFFVLLTGTLFILAGCATTNPGNPSVRSADQTAQLFFDHLQKSHREEAYALFAKGLSQTISFGHFDDFMETLQEQWGRIEGEESAVMPFHQRMGEGDFIPLNTAESDIKRYVYEVKFEHAQVNCDLTIVKINDEYKIVWLSFWGSSVYMTPEITSKIEELFSKSASMGENQF